MCVWGGGSGDCGIQARTVMSMTCLPACLTVCCCHVLRVMSLAVPAGHCSGTGPPGAAGGLLPGSCRVRLLPALV